MLSDSTTSGNVVKRSNELLLEYERLTDMNMKHEMQKILRHVDYYNDITIKFVDSTST